MSFSKLQQDILNDLLKPLTDEQINTAIIENLTRMMRVSWEHPEPYDFWRGGEDLTDVKEKGCECGAHKVSSSMHSDWCPKGIK